MTNFGQDWNKQSNSGISEKFQGLVKKEQPLKPRIENTIKELNSPISKLNRTSNQLSEKEQKIFNRIVQAKQNGDIRTAKALANELAQMRKTSSMIGNMRLSIEKTQLRLTTANSVGDTIVAMRPAVDTMKVVVPAMSNVMSQASGEVESMGNMLGDMMPGSIGEDFSSAESGANQETNSILQEAAAVAGTQIGEKFPSVPTSTDSIMASADSLAEL
ncbi:MAG: Snf7 family protein [Nitrosopumilus sp.]|nr:Snf7 family protein [Nitrosopumilus sp.]NRA04921.1 Snf7 family protein [Nitrosopumilus sp.]